MAVVVKTCCCGCDLRTGVLLIGIFGLLGAGYAIYNDFQLSKALTDIDESGEYEKLPMPQKYLKVVTNLSYAGVAFAIISVLVNSSLLLSSCWKNRYLAYPWFIWNILGLFYTFGLTVFFISIWNGFSYVFIGTLFGCLLLIYFIVVVYSYIENLREDPSAFGPSLPPDIMTQMQAPPYERFA